MIKYLIRRILIFIPMLLALTIIVFGLMEAAPGDVFTGNPDPKIDQKVFDKQRKALGLDDPFYVQYYHWLEKVVKGDFGESYVYKGRTVLDLIGERADNTFYLGIFTLFITLIVAIPIGIYSARNPYSIFDYGATTFGFLGLAVPSFFFGLLAIYVFSINLGWFPSQGTVTTPDGAGFDLFLDKLHHLVLPGLTLGLAGTATYMRFMRSEVLDVLSSDYIRTARAKGMTEKNILYKQTLRNAMIPIVTLLGFELANLMGGAIITESVYQYPGLGNLFISAISNRDYPIIMAMNLMLGILVLVGNLLADIFYSIVDPRIRYD
jgi:peptide/nickel transport system permease protein